MKSESRLQDECSNSWSISKMYVSEWICYIQASLSPLVSCSFYKGKKLNCIFYKAQLTKWSLMKRGRERVIESKREEVQLDEEAYNCILQIYLYQWAAGSWDKRRERLSESEWLVKQCRALCFI